MKKSILYVSLAASFMVASCGGKEESKGDSEKKSENTEETEDEEGPKRLTAADLDVSKPIACEVANAEIMCWENKEIEVAGSVYKFYGDSAAVDYGSLVLLAKKGSGKQAVSVSLKNRDNKFKVHKDDVIHLKGKVSGTYFDTLVSMYDAEVVAITKKVETVKLDPSKTGVFDAGELQNDCIQWNNKEIAVQGNYMMTTTSKTSYGTTIRVDLKGPKSDYADVGCEFAEDPSDKLKDNREGVIIKGKIKPGGSFGKLQLYDCQLVNR